MNTRTRKVGLFFGSLHQNHIWLILQVILLAQLLLRADAPESGGMPGG